MRGSILGYDAGAGVSVVRGEDGRRYAFAPPSWREQRPPRKGDLVDFEARGDRAEMVFLLTAPKDREKLAEPGALLGLAARHPVLRTLLERPVLVTGLLVLLACFADVFHPGNDDVSLYAVPDLVSGFARALDAMVGGTGGDSQPRLISTVLRFCLLFQYLLYAVPLLAARAVWKEVSGQPAGGLGRHAGLAAMLLPVLLPLLVIVPVHLVLLPSVSGTTVRLGGGGIEVPRQAFDVLRFYGTGTVLLIFSGLALWASATGRFQPLRGERRPDASSPTVMRDGPASFGPPSVRKDESDEQMEMVLPAALQRRQQAGDRPAARAGQPAPEAVADAPDAAKPAVRRREGGDAASASASGMHWPRWPSRERSRQQRDTRPAAASESQPVYEDDRIFGRPDEPPLDRMEPDYLETGEEPYFGEEEDVYEPLQAEPAPQPRPQPAPQLQPHPRPQPQPQPQPRQECAPEAAVESDMSEAALPQPASAPAVRAEARSDPRDWRRFEEDDQEPLLRRYVSNESEAASQRTRRQPEPEQPEPAPEPEPGQPDVSPETEVEAWGGSPLPSAEPEWEPAPPAPGREPERETPDWQPPQRQERGPLPERRQGRPELDDLSMLASDLRSALESEIGRNSFSARREPPGPAAEREPGGGPPPQRQAPFTTRDTSFAGAPPDEGPLPAEPYYPADEPVEPSRPARSAPLPARRREPGPEGEER